MADRQNKMFLWALAFAARNTVGFSHFTWTGTIRAQEIPLHLLLQTKETINALLKNRMEIFAQRILKQHMNAFNGFVVCNRVPSGYSCEKSRIVILDFLFLSFLFLFLRTVFCLIGSSFKLSETFVNIVIEADFKHEAIHYFIEKIDFYEILRLNYTSTMSK